MEARVRIAAVFRSMLFTLEGWAGLLLSTAVGAILAAVFTQAFRFRLGPAIVFGVGVGLLALASFAWFVLVPRRDRLNEREVVLRNSVKNHLRDLAEKGEVYARSVPPRDVLRRWSSDVDTLIHEAFGPEAAARLPEDVPIAEFVDEILMFARTDAETLPLRPTYRGFKRRA